MFWQPGLVCTFSKIPNIVADYGNYDLPSCVKFV